ncbi:MAG: helix-hairpin-helix domain-containing protein [Candidatus Sumerlaeia bacterium]
MYGGMTRNEWRGLIALLILIVAGVAVRAWVSERESGSMWIEFDPKEGAEKLAAAQPEVQATPTAIDLNAADAQELASRLSGIGQTKARAIVEYRENNGRFQSVEELEKVPGIGPKTIERIRSDVHVSRPEAPEIPQPDAPESPHIPQQYPFPGTEPATVTQRAITSALPQAEKTEITSPPNTITRPKKATVPKPAMPEINRPTRPEVPKTTPAANDGRININTATSEELQTLYRVGPVTAEKIILYRAKHGPFQTVDDITKISGIGPKTLERNRDKIKVR